MRDDIAIVGIGLKIADCSSFQEYDLKLQKRENLCQNLEGRRLKDICNYLKIIHKNVGQMPGEKHYFLKDIDLFDYAAFHISPKEAAYMDPNQRLMLETVYHAFADSGMDIKKGSNTAVFIGYRENHDYLELVKAYDSDMLSFALPGNLPAAIAGRISYTFDWRGNCQLIDSGDSSSVLALQSACGSISSGEADIAVAGGIDLYILPFEDQDRGGIYEWKPKGECVAVVVLKSLSHAIRDRDPIFGVIKCCISNRGSLHDSLLQKENLLADCLRMAGDRAGQITIVELSGTADTREQEVLKRLLNKSQNLKNEVPVIDVLSDDIANLEVSSGLMGLIKALLSHDSQRNEFYSTDDKEMCLLAHFGKSGGNTGVILEKARVPVRKRKRLSAEKGKPALENRRCWIDN